MQVIYFQSAYIRNVVQISFWKVTLNRTGFYLEGNQFKKFSVKSYACEKDTAVNTRENVNTSKIGKGYSGVALSHVHSSREMSDQTDSERSGKPSQKITNVTYYKECVSSETSDHNVYHNTCHVCSKNFNNLEELHLHQLACQNINNNKNVLLHCKFCSKVIDLQSNLLSHERACERKIKQKQMSQQNKNLLLHCKFCSKVMDNKCNLSSHE